MTTEDIAYDTWAWWERLMGESNGTLLEKRHSGRRIVTSAWVIGELVAKLRGRIPDDAIARMLTGIRAAGPVVDVTAELAEAGAILRRELRKHASRASLGDGVILATARSRGLKLVSGDAAFAGQRDVVSV